MDKNEKWARKIIHTEKMGRKKTMHLQMNRKTEHAKELAKNPLLWHM